MHDHHMRVLAEARIANLRDDADRDRLPASIKAGRQDSGSAPPLRFGRVSLHALLRRAALGLGTN